MSTAMKSSKSDWLIPCGLLALSMVPAIAGTVRLTQLAGGAAVTSENARFFASPIPVVIHIVAVLVYSIVGAFQFSPGFRRRHRPWHRAAGKALAVCGMLAALSGLWMAHFYPWPAGDGQLVYLERLTFGTAMFLAIVLGLDAIRRRDFASHGAWMLRAYAIGLGAGTQVFTHLPWFMFVGGKPGELPRAVMMGAGWTINVILAEWIIRRRDANGVRHATTPRTTASRSARTPAPPPAVSAPDRTVLSMPHQAHERTARTPASPS